MPKHNIKPKPRPRPAPPKIKRVIDKKARRAGKVKTSPRGKVSVVTSSRRSARVSKARSDKLATLALPPTSGWTSSNAYSGKEHLKLFSGSYSGSRAHIKDQLDAQLGGAPGADAPAHIKAFAAKLASVDDDKIECFADSSGRTVLARGRIRGAQKAGKGTTPEAPNNSRLAGDDRGHLVAEDAVAPQANPNRTENIIAENAVINQQYKTPFEEFVKTYAATHPGEIVHTVHEPIYNGTDVRPSRVNHFIVVDGQVRATLTLLNPSDLTHLTTS